MTGEVMVENLAEYAEICQLARRGVYRPEAGGAYLPSDDPSNDLYGAVFYRDDTPNGGKERYFHVYVPGELLRKSVVGFENAEAKAKAATDEAARAKAKDELLKLRVDALRSLALPDDPHRNQVVERKQ